MSDPNVTQMLPTDPNRTVMSSAPSLNVTQTIQPVQCPVCKSFNPAGESYCVECGLVLASALPDDVFGAPSVRPPCLVDESGREHFFRPGTNLVGREGDIMITDSRVSRKHAEITLNGNSVTIRDLGSTNGTQLRGTTVSDEQTIENGDKVSFGGVELTMSFPGESQATMMPNTRKTQAMDAPPMVEKPPAYWVAGDDRVPLKRGENTLGRRPTNDIVMTDPYTSGAHAKIFVEEDEIFFEDIGSTNGTMLNGAKLPANERVKVSEDDELMIGESAFSIRRETK